MRPIHLLAAAVICLPLAAQQNVGIYLSRGISTISGVLCGFNCGSAGNTGTATAMVSQAIDLRVIGDPGMPALLLAAPGPAFACPGIPIVGMNNALLLNPGGVFVVGIAPSVGAGGRTQCSPAGGLQLMFANLTLPPSAFGLLVTFQAAVFDGAMPAFTRPIELTVN